MVNKDLCTLSLLYLGKYQMISPGRLALTSLLPVRFACLCKYEGVTKVHYIKMLKYLWPQHIDPIVHAGRNSQKNHPVCALL